MNKQKITEVRKDLNKAFEELAKKYGMTFGIGNIRFNNQGFRTKLTATVVDGDPTNQVEAEKAKFDQHCQQFGFTSEDYGKTFTSHGKVYEFVGFKPRSYKYPCICRQLASGKQYKFTSEDVIFLIKHSKS